jgi:hypothetical protein
LWRKWGEFARAGRKSGKLRISPNKKKWAAKSRRNGRIGTTETQRHREEQDREEQE